MPRRQRASQRSATEWIVRGLLALVLAGIGWVAVAHTLANSLRTSNPARAYALAPGDGRVAAQRAQQLAGAEAGAAERARADQLARKALRQDATAVAAVATLGLDAQIRGDTAGARRLFGYAERLSRRDLQTQLWAIEDAVGRADIADALRHYDIALRTSRAAPDLLYPVLLSAGAEPAVRAELVRTLAAGPIWRPTFIAYAAANRDNPQATAGLFLALRRAGVPVPQDASATLIGALVARNLMAPAWAYYASSRPGIDRRRSRDPQFTAELTLPSAFDWTTVSDAGATASIQRTESGGLLDFAAPASVGGPLVRQLQLLPPGEYRIEGHSIGIDQSSENQPYWTLVCPDGRELGRVAVPNSSNAGGRFAGRLSVSADCPAQILTLVARPSDAVGGLSGQIDRVQLAPAG